MAGIRTVADTDTSRHILTEGNGPLYPTAFLAFGALWRKQTANPTVA